ncbi:unnamed protein product [Aphanomyces euteiches]
MYGRWNARMNEVELKPYPGDRSVDSLVKFGKRMAGDVVSSITSDKEWEQYFSVDGSMLVFGQSAQPDAKEVEMLELYKKTAALTKFFVYSDQLPTFFVWNTEAQVFYNYEGPHDAESMRQFLSNILVGKERAIGQANYPLKIYRYFVRGYPWTLLWLIPGSVVLFFIGLGFYGFLKYDDKAEKRALAQISQGTSKAKKDE